MKSKSRKRNPFVGLRAVAGGAIAVLLVLVRTSWVIGYRDPNVPLPEQTTPSPNAYDLFLNAGRSIRDPAELEIAFNRPQAISERELARAVDKNKGAFDGFDRGLRLAIGPRARWSNVRSRLGTSTQNGSGSAVAMPHWSNVRFRVGTRVPYQAPRLQHYTDANAYATEFRLLERALIVRGDLRKRKGDWDGAAGCYLDAMEFGEIIPHGATTIGWYTGVQFVCDADDRLWKVIDSLTAAGTEDAIARVRRIGAIRVSAAESLDEEKWSTVAYLQELFRSPRAVEQFYDCNPEGSNTGTYFALKLGFFGKKRVLDDYIGYRDAVEDNLRIPYALRAPAPPPPADPFIGQFGPLGLGFSDARTLAQSALLETALALRLYRLERGAYPGRLNDLVGRYLERVPSDPFAAWDRLGYRRKGNGYLLYSVGPDGIDNSGVPVFHPDRRPRGSEQYRVNVQDRGDIVAGTNI